MSDEYRGMKSDNSRSSSFLTTQQDISRLKRTATDAVNDLGDDIPVRSVGEKVIELAHVGRDYVSRYPLRTVGAALAVGFVVGLVCACVSSDKRSSK